MIYALFSLASAPFAFQIHPRTKRFIPLGAFFSKLYRIFCRNLRFAKRTRFQQCSVNRCQDTYVSMESHARNTRLSLESFRYVGSSIYTRLYLLGRSKRGPTEIDRLETVGEPSLLLIPLSKTLYSFFSHVARKIRSSSPSRKSYRDEINVAINSWTRNKKFV